MILTTEQIDKNIRWLLDNGTLPVQYLTHKYLLKTPEDSETMCTLWQDVEKCAEVKEIFGKQAQDGSWYAGGSWAKSPSYAPGGGIDPYNPKYVTTVWVLPILGEMGFTTKDSRIKKACDFVLEHGYFLDPYFFDSRVAAHDAHISPCRFAQYLIALGSVDCYDDIRLQKGYEYLLKMQREDGGWALPKHMEERRWTRSCPWSSYHSAAALYYKKDKDYSQELIRALQFLVNHLSEKTGDEKCRFFYHGHNTVNELLMLSEYGVGLNEAAVQTIVLWLMTMYREGYFRYSGKPISQYTQKFDSMDSRVAKYRLHHLIEDDWLTYYMTRISMNLL